MRDEMASDRDNDEYQSLGGITGLAEVIDVLVSTLIEMIMGNTGRNRSHRESETRRQTTRDNLTENP